MAHGTGAGRPAHRPALPELAGGLFFAGQVALATGLRTSQVAEAAEALRARDGGDPCLAWC